MVLTEVSILFFFVAISNALFLPPNANPGEHFLNQKLSFLEAKFKDSPIDFNLIKEKIEAKKQAEAEENMQQKQEPSEPQDPIIQQKLWFLENKFKGPKFDFIKQKIEAKQQAKLEAEKQETNNEDTLQQKLAFLEDLLLEISAEKTKLNHQVSKRSTKNEEGASVKDPAIGDYFLNQKMTFLENKFKNTMVDFNTIKEKIEAKKEAKKQEEAAAAAEKSSNQKLVLLLNFLKQIHTEKLSNAHSISKRSVKNIDGTEGAKDPDFGAAIGQHFLNQKLTFLENKFKGTMVDFDAIKEKIEAKKEAKLVEETPSVPSVPKDQALNEKLQLLQIALREFTADQLAMIIERIEGNHKIAKRAAKEGDKSSVGTAKRDYFMKQKFDFLDAKLKEKNVDSAAIKNKIKLKQKGTQ